MLKVFANNKNRNGSRNNVTVAIIKVGSIVTVVVTIIMTYVSVEVTAAIPKENKRSCKKFLNQQRLTKFISQ